MVRRAAHPILVELAAVLEDVARALAQRDREAIQAALERGRAIEDLERDFEEALDVGRETTMLAPPRRRARDTVESFAAAGAQIDLAVRNVRVLARAARRAIDLDEHIPEAVGEAVRDLARAVRALDVVLGEDEDADEGTSAESVREPALRAAACATIVLEQTGNMSVTVIVGQIRSTAVDILRSSGLSYREAADAVRAAARAAAVDER